MDPQQTWTDLVTAVIEDDGLAAREAATALLVWLRSCGFPLQTLGNQQMPDGWNRAVAHAACRSVLQVSGHDRRVFPLAVAK